MNTEFEVLTDTLVHIGEVREALGEVTHDLQQRGVAHDRTKLQEPEFSVFCSTRPEFKKANYGTPEYAAVVKKANVAVDHHYANNRHHTAFHANGIEDMNLLDVLEMLADWKAAARRSPDLTFKDSLPRAFSKYRIDPIMQRMIVNTLEYLGWLPSDLDSAVQKQGREGAPHE